ncbi:MAG: Uncharacterised protein [Flavobacteriaceae bacterium]|nr:MAG: Uncharacterised protein [Flavobacteriaceae bacterium]
MKKYTHTIQLLGVFFLGSTFGFSQTTNEGILHVSSNTLFSSVDAFDNKANGDFTNNGESYFYSHFNNDGEVDFDAAGTGERVTRFDRYATNPSEVQKITGSKTSKFFEVIYDNDSGLVPTYELHNKMSITKVADFNNGIVDNDNFGGLLIFENDAEAVRMNDDSHVDGKVQKKGDDAFVNPVGDVKKGEGYYRMAAISAPSSVDHDFTTKYFYDNPLSTTAEGQSPTANMGGNIELIDQAEFWTVTKDKGTADVILTLSYNSSTTPSSLTSSTEKLSIARWNNTAKIWEDLGGIVNTANQTVTTPVTLDAYGIFTLANTGADELVVYNGVSNNGDGVNDYFEIKNINALKNNNVKIFNRWGIKVYETNNYDSNGNVFRGNSNGRATVSSNEHLPTGTYYYVVSYDNDSNERVTKSGYLYITTE